jgi:hypothetical protein
VRERENADTNEGSSDGGEVGRGDVAVVVRELDVVSGGTAVPSQAHQPPCRSGALS